MIPITPRIPLQEQGRAMVKRKKTLVELVTESPYEHDHLTDLFILFLCQLATLLDQSSHTDDLHALLLGESS